VTPPARRPEVRNTGAATASAGGVANTGWIDNLTVHSQPPAQSTYPALVRQIAPERLVGRDAELAEMAAFCTEPAVNLPYQWWRAPMWGGKSALLAWFVLHSPEHVRPVSFFVSSLRAGHDHRAGFADVVGEQLAEILGWPMPVLTEATRHGTLIGMFEKAAALLRERGERLILVLDGIDEDQGAGTHSIAGMLPPGPPHGMRVIVASRPSPPLPGDVPDGHPLRRPQAHRLLSISPYASVVRQTAERDLDRLLVGGVVEQDLLGVLAAAGGGLSAADLQALTGCYPRQIDLQLRAVTARSLVDGPDEWRRDVIVYVLGHRELYLRATDFLGPQRLAEYRQRLHHWADGYRARAWPMETPEYLLRPYYGMLADNDDLSRMVACATDAARHDRMLDVSGGDTAALSEITTLLDRACQGEAIPPETLALLALHRDILIQRNAGIPTGLPAVWALLGQTSRARALVGPITEPKRRTEALASLVEAMADVNDFDQAEVLAGAISDESAQAGALDHLVAVLVTAGRPDRAEEVTRSAFAEDYRCRALALLAKAHAIVGDFQRAETLADAIPELDQQAQGLAFVAEHLSRAGDHERARAIAARVTELSRQATEADTERLAPLFAVKAVAATGDLDLALAMARDATYDYVRSHGIREVVRATADAGDLDRAEELAREVPKGLLGDDDWAYGDVARAAARMCDWERAQRLIHRLASYPFYYTLLDVAAEVAAAGDVDRSEGLARSLTAPDHRRREDYLPDALVAVAKGAARAGNLKASLAVVDAIDGSYAQAKALTAVARGMARAGRRDDARRLAVLAESRSRSLGWAGWANRVLPDLARAVADSGHAGQAGELVRRIRSRDQRADTVRAIVVSLAAAARFDEAETLARSVTNAKSHDYRGKAAGPLVQALAAAGDLDRAGALFHDCIDSLNWQIDPILALVEAHARHGDEAYARYFARLIARDNWEQPWVALAAGLAERDLNAAVDVTNAIADRYWRAEAAAHLMTVAYRLDNQEQLAEFADAAEELVGIGTANSEFLHWMHVDEAERAARLGQLSGSIPEDYRQGRAIVTVAREMAGVGFFDRAATLIRSLGKREWRRESAAGLLTAAIGAGRLSLARELAEEFADPQVWARFAAEAAAGGHRSQALEILARAASLIPEGTNDAWSAALACLAHAAATVEPEQVVKLAEGIPDADQQAATLATAAADLPDSEALPLVARAFRAGTWTAPLSWLAVRSPESLPRLADAFIEAATLDQAEAEPDEAFAPEPMPVTYTFRL
jgi:tetratricopeptide (TPR) repeat protein